MLIHRANANRNVFEMGLELLIALILGPHILGLWAHSRAAGSSPVTTTWLDGGTRVAQCRASHSKYVYITEKQYVLTK